MAAAEWNFMAGIVRNDPFKLKTVGHSRLGVRSDS
jgi:hypothetical protein